MLVSKITARNFEGIDSVDLELGPLTVLYGPNAAGKSSVRDALDHALTGEPQRSGVLSDLVRQGAKRSELEVVLAPRKPDERPVSVMRNRTRNAGEAFIDGVDSKADEVTASIRARVGAPASQVAAALRAGAILDLKPAELQPFLQALTGAKLDEQAIRDAFEPAVIEAAKRAHLELPGRIEQFASYASAAEGARKVSKRMLAEREADLERLAPGREGVREQLHADLAVLEIRHKTALAQGGRTAGAREERIRALKTLLAAMPETPEPATGEGLDAAESALAEAKHRARALEVEVATLKGKLGDAVPPVVEAPSGDRTAVETRVGEASARRLEAYSKVERLADEGKAKKALLDRMPAAGCVGPCPVLPDTTCPLTDLSALTTKLKAARADVAGLWKTAAQELKAADAELEAALNARDAYDTAAMAAKRRADYETTGALIARALASAADANAKAKEQETAVAARRAEFEARVDWMQRARARQQALGELAKVEAEPVPVQAEPTDALDSEIAKAREAIEAAAQHARYKAARSAVETASVQVEDADTVAKACGPAGVKARLLARAVAPFLTAANEALAKLAPDGFAVEMSDAFEIMLRRGTVMLRPAQLSDGERTRLTFTIQYAVAKLAGVRLLILDRTELLDQAGRSALKRMAEACAAEGTQVVMMTCANPPDGVAPGVTGYAMAAGRAKRIPEAMAKAA